MNPLTHQALHRPRFATNFGAGIASNPVSADNTYYEATLPQLDAGDWCFGMVTAASAAPGAGVQHGMFSTVADAAVSPGLQCFSNGGNSGFAFYEVMQLGGASELFQYNLHQGPGRQYHIWQRRGANYEVMSGPEDSVKVGADLTTAHTGTTIPSQIWRLGGHHRAIANYPYPLGWVFLRVGGSLTPAQFTSWAKGQSILDLLPVPQVLLPLEWGGPVAKNLGTGGPAHDANLIGARATPAPRLR